MDTKETRLASGEIVSTEEALNRFFNREIGFFDLKEDIQKAILQYIKEKDPEQKVLGRNWYDVLQDKFCVVEVLLREDYENIEEPSECIYSTIKEFDEFDSFYSKKQY